MTSGTHLKSALRFFTTAFFATAVASEVRTLKQSRRYREELASKEKKPPMGSADEPEGGGGAGGGRGRKGKNE